MRTSPRSIVRRLSRVLLCVAAALPVVAVVGTAAAEPAGPRPCAWRFMSDGNVLDVAFPDVNATYWVLPYALGATDSIEVSGTYPSARYFSLNTYGTDLDTTDTLRDDQILPDPGSGNPFTDSGAQGLPPERRRWHATLVTGPAEHQRNEIRALRDSGPPVGFLIIRVYVPDDPASRSGGAPLPEVAYRRSGTTIPVQPCSQPFDPRTLSAPVADAGQWVVDRAIERAASDALRAGTPEATFVNPASTSGLFPNGDNKYIGAVLTYRPGRIAVVRGRAPAFPDTRAGASPTEAGQQVRYWSMCQNDLVSPYPVVACAADFQTTLDADGRYTYVVAAPGDVPSNVDPTVTVLPWGSTDVPKKLLILRNMLPTAEFYPASIQASQANGTDPAATMGDYYPEVAYCSTVTFEMRGYAGCFEGDRR
ncbi:hypothetical protein [Prescottella agglutinans]|uniref:Uncharacterized protein n=1 Tax=Prescottella agglutinans TaxID=1644129 RepID=A0ABT6MMF4_9NOCA|nr:hypothetical protein [Prescottella agglutinans]MDH6284739.1 hypothetical protein [Prescottella agglutinans]